MVLIFKFFIKAEQHGNDNVTFTMLMPFALNNEHQAAQMFYFLLSKIVLFLFYKKMQFYYFFNRLILAELQRDGVVDLEQEMFEYPKEPGDIFIKLLLQD